MLRKIGIFFIVAVIMSFALAGCKANNGAAAPEAANPAPTQAQASDTAAAGPTQAQASATTDPSAATAADQQASATNNQNEKAVAPEKNPPGDIPDTQVFIKYASSSDGYELQVPEGWSRTENGAVVRFIDKFDGIQVQTSQGDGTVSLDTIKQNQAAEIEKSGRAVKIKKVKAVKLDGGSAILVSYDSNSDPEPVTGKQIRLENESYFFCKAGKTTELKLWAPLGADNVDQWRLISNSFRWR